MAPHKSIKASRLRTTPFEREGFSFVSWRRSGASSGVPVSADELVPRQDAIDARAAADGRPDLVVLPGVDHRFTDAIPAMTAAVAAWLGPQVEEG